MESFDMVIIGAGPGGLSCAKNLSDKKVLLLEKNPVIGPKVCAGGIAGEDVDYLNIPEDLIDFTFRDILVHTSTGSQVIKLDDSFTLFTIDRKNLGQWQLKQLGKNVTVRTGAKVTAIGRDHVVVNRSEKIGFRYLVGADGSSSIVRRHLNLDSSEVGVTVQYVVPTEKYRKFEVFFDAKLFGVWYAWIFPHRKYASIGCGCDPNMISPSTLRKNFHSWLEQNGIDVSKGEFQSHPINVDFRGYRFGNVFLIGDAAGLASCITGDGIYQAAISGEEVAKLILDPKHKPSKLEKIIKENEEEKAIMRKLKAMLKKHGPVPEIEQELLRLFESD